MFYFSSILFLYFFFKCKAIYLNFHLIKKKPKIYLESYKLKEKFYILKNKYSNSKRNLIPSKRNLILSTVINYKWEVIQPFFKSFESVEFENCDCVVFVSKLSNYTIKKIKSCGAIIKIIPKEYSKMNVNKMRWKMYFDYVIDNKDKYKLVLATDSRDAFFQQDLFQFYDSKQSFLGLALEDDYLNEKVLRYWIKYAFGNEIYKKLENKRMICAGTIWGTVDKFLQLANKMWEIVKNNSSNLKFHDQAVFSYVIYILKPFDDCLKKSEYKDGYVITLGLVNKNIALDEENNILNGKGEIAALVHQYDRKKEITKIVRKKFCVEGKIYNSKIISKKKNKKLKFFIFFLLFILIIIIIVIIIIFYRLKYISKKKDKLIYKNYKKVNIKTYNKN